MSATINPDEVTLKSVLAIQNVKYAKSETKGKYYIVILFKDPRWAEYIQKELWFRLNDNEMYKFSLVPTKIIGNSLLLLLENELERVKPKTIRIFAAPPPGEVFIKEFQIDVENIVRK